MMEGGLGVRGMDRRGNKVKERENKKEKVVFMLTCSELAN